MDSRIKPRAATGAIGQKMQAIEEASQGETMDKRLAKYRQLRDQVHSALRSDKDEEDQRQISELNKKIEQLERAQRLKDQRDQLVKDTADESRGKSNKGLIGGITSYTVEDI
jgi:TolA-binding protein